MIHFHKHKFIIQTSVSMAMRTGLQTSRRQTCLLQCTMEMTFTKSIQILVFFPYPSPIPSPARECSLFHPTRLQNSRIKWQTCKTRDFSVSHRSALSEFVCCLKLFLWLRILQRNESFPVFSCFFSVCKILFLFSFYRFLDMSNISFHIQKLNQI